MQSTKAVMAAYLLVGDGATLGMSAEGSAVAPACSPAETSEASLSSRVRR